MDGIDGDAATREAFLGLFRSFPSGLGIVTTADADGRPHGLTTNGVASVSADPPMLLVCVALTSRTLPPLRRRGRFVLHVMAHGSEHHCGRFATKVEDKFAGMTWEHDDDGLPHIREGVVGWAVCEIEQEVEAADHLILVARVLRAGLSGADAEPLVYLNRSFGIWRPALAGGAGS